MSSKSIKAILDDNEALAKKAEKEKSIALKTMKTGIIFSVPTFVLLMILFLENFSTLRRLAGEKEYVVISLVAIAAFLAIVNFLILDNLSPKTVEHVWWSLRVTITVLAVVLLVPFVFKIWN